MHKAKYCECARRGLYYVHKKRTKLMQPWPLRLKFNRVLAVVEVHVQQFHQAKCSGSWVIVRTEKKKLRRKQYSPSLPRTVINAGCHITSLVKVKIVGKRALPRKNWGTSPSDYIHPIILHNWFALSATKSFAVVRTMQRSTCTWPFVWYVVPSSPLPSPFVKCNQRSLRCTS